MDNDGTGKPIEIIISTVGGEIYSGFNFVDQIEKAKSPVTIHIMSMAASMGFLIAMAGKIIQMWKRYVILLALDFYIVVLNIWRVLLML